MSGNKSGTIAGFDLTVQDADGVRDLYAEVGLALMQNPHAN